MGDAWTWDPSLYAGSAAYYAVGRVPYPPQVADRLQQALALSGRERLLDVGCGPGNLTLLLAPLVAQAIGVDPDPDMLEVAARLAAAARLENVVWRRLRGEELPADLPAVDVVTFAQSFHWMDRPRVAAAARRMLRPGGALVHVSANTHEGPADAQEGLADLPYPRPPHPAVRALVQRYLGPTRRAGRSSLAAGTPGGEDDIYRAAGFTGPEQLTIPGRVVERSVAQVAAAVYSLSSAAPYLFGDEFRAFDTDLRELLRRSAPGGRFAEEMAPIRLDLWR